MEDKEKVEKPFDWWLKVQAQTLKYNMLARLNSAKSFWMKFVTLLVYSWILELSCASRSDGLIRVMGVPALLLWREF